MLPVGQVRSAATKLPSALLILIQKQRPGDQAAVGVDSGAKVRRGTPHDVALARIRGGALPAQPASQVGPAVLVEHKHNHQAYQADAAPKSDSPVATITATNSVCMPTWLGG